MKLSREKVVQLSHQIMGAFEELDEVEIFDEPNNIRQEIVKIFIDLLHDEEKVDASVRQKITSQKRSIPEGSAEWDILYRKYYSDELRRMGIVISSPGRS